MKKIGWGIVGYGGSYNMGREHATFMQGTGLMKPVAFCEIDKERLALAAKEFPGAATYSGYDQLLADPRVEGVTIITPHNLHYPMALKALKSGRHVIVEKPICITVKQVDTLISIAKKKRKLVSAYHNRRWDGDILTIKKILKSGRIGEVFHAELAANTYAHPGHTWRSDIKLSGGTFYDWGVHLVDYCLEIIPDPIHSVSGFFHKLVWDVTNEDHTQAIIRFKTGKFASVSVSTIEASPREKFRILGTRGAITGGWDRLKIFTPGKQGMQVKEVKVCPPEYRTYYRNVAAHLTGRTPLIITPERARRNIGVIEAAGKSARSGKPVRPPHE